MNSILNKILLIEDNPGDARLVQVMLSEVDDPTFSFDIECAAKLSTGLEFLAKNKVNVILLDLSLPDSHGLDTFFKVYKQSPETPIVVLSGFKDETLSIEAVKNGAQDYLVKGHVDGHLLKRSIRYAIERQGIERELLESKQRYTRLVQMVPDVVYTIDAEGVFTFVNDAIRNLGYEPEQLAGRHFNVIMHPDDAVLVSRSKVLSRNRDNALSAKDVPRLFDERRTEKRKTMGLEVRLLRNKTNASDNEYVYVEVNASGLYIKNIGREEKVFLGTIGIMRDITERKQTEAAIQQMAFYDSVTGLPNRTLFRDRISMSLAHAQRVNGMLAVLFLDLDKFKLVNDSLGHAVGDQLLKTVADRLVNCTRKGDTVARMGGDEFTLLLPVIKHKGDAEEVADKILEKISHPFVIDGHELTVTTSIGIAMYPADGKDIDALLKNADIAMYYAKDAGGNNYKHYTKMLSVKVSRRMVMENELRQALERKEFFVYYQPQINVNTGRIVGVEALLRWQHHELGLVFPSEFVPVAEGAGMIVPVSEWMLSAVCAQGKAWQSAGLPAVRLAVKLPSHVFQWRSFMETINRVLQETGMAPSLLELEITETAAMRNVEVTATRLSLVNALGVKIAIDDFGIGYSSLSCLSSYPIHTLKIGKSFVHGISVNPHVESIVKAIIIMAKNLKMNVIAEGVETREQLAFLKEYQCEEAQGPLFCKPESPAIVEKMLSQDTSFFNNGLPGARR